MSTIYKLDLFQKSGLLSPLHSDTIMGHFCWRFKERFGADELDKFCALYEEKPVFTLSDGLGVYDGKLFFPKPEYISSFKKPPQTKKEKVKQFLETKNRKGLKYTNAAGLNMFLKGDIEGYEKHLTKMEEEKVKMPSFTPGLRVSVTIDRAQMKAADGGLYSYSPVYPDYLASDKEKKTTQAILVRIFDEELFRKYEAGALLKEVFETGFGKKKSSGYGVFECSELKEYHELKEPESPNAFMTLGHYTPAPSDGVTKGYYSHTVKYGKLGEERANDLNPFKKPIISFKPGGVFIVKKPKLWYGLITDDVVKEVNNIWHFGAPLTVNIKIP